VARAWPSGMESGKQAPVCFSWTPGLPGDEQAGRSSPGIRIARHRDSESLGLCPGNGTARCRGPDRHDEQCERDGFKRISRRGFGHFPSVSATNSVSSPKAVSATKRGIKTARKLWHGNDFEMKFLSNPNLNPHSLSYLMLAGTEMQGGIILRLVERPRAARCRLLRHRLFHFHQLRIDYSLPLARRWIWPMTCMSCASPPTGNDVLGAGGRHLHRRLGRV